MTFDLNWLYLSTEGRMGRAAFWTGIAGIAAVVLVAALIVAFTLGPFTFAGQLVVFLCELAIAYPLYALLTKRFQDRGRPGVLAAIPVAITLLIAFIRLMGWAGPPLQPNAFDLVLSSVSVVVGVWILVDLGIQRGTVGPNEYGPDPVGTM